MLDPGSCTEDYLLAPPRLALARDIEGVGVPNGLEADRRCERFQEKDSGPFSSVTGVAKSLPTTFSHGGVSNGQRGLAGDVNITVRELRPIRFF